VPREGEGYTKPLGGIQQRKGGPYYNISVTIDRETLNIIDAWPKGTKSERIRWAIKDRHYGRHPRLTEEIETLYANIAALQRVISEGNIKHGNAHVSGVIIWLKRLRNLFYKNGK